MILPFSRITTDCFLLASIVFLVHSIKVMSLIQTYSIMTVYLVIVKITSPFPFIVFLYHHFLPLSYIVPLFRSHLFSYHLLDSGASFTSSSTKSSTVTTLFSSFLIKIQNNKDRTILCFNGPKIKLESNFINYLFYSLFLFFFLE